MLPKSSVVVGEAIPINVRKNLKVTHFRPEASSSGSNGEGGNLSRSCPSLDKSLASTEVEAEAGWGFVASLYIANKKRT